VTTTLLASIPSPAQGVWYLGPFPIRAYALFIIVGIVVALVIGDRRWAARGGEPGVIYDISLWAVPFGLIGGRIYHVITDWSKYFSDGGAGFIGALRIWDGGLGIWGAVAFGGVGAWIACRRRGIPLPAFGDAIAPGIVLAQAIGRLGNYFNQELYGHPTTLPWGLEIYERENASGVVSPDLANGVSTGQLYSIVHPTFLYELLWNVAVFAVLIWVDRKFKIGHGRLFALYVAGYCLGRFWIELLRNDQATLIADIRVNSFTSTFVFIGAVVYIMVAPKGREDPETLQGTTAVTDDDDSGVEDFVKELSTVGATAGVVAAAKAAGEAAGESESDDATIAGESGGADDEPKSEAAAEAEDLAEAVAVAPAEQIVEAEEFAEKVREADEAEASTDGEPESAFDAEDGGETASVGGVGAIEGEDVAAAEEAAPEAHEVAVDGQAQAEDLSADIAEPAESSDSRDVDDEDDSGGEVGEVAGDDAVEPAGDRDEPESVEGDDVGDDVAQAEELAPESVDEASESADAELQTDSDAEENEAPASDDGVGAVESDADTEAKEAAPADEADESAEGEPETDASAGETEEPGPVGGLGAVEGDDVTEAEDAAAEAHEVAVEGEAHAEELTADLAETADSDEATTAAAEPLVGDVDDDEGPEAQETEPEPDVSEADATVVDEKTNAAQSQVVQWPSASESADEPRGRIRRWLRGRRGQ
jgi:prolipoprotein diacylglyceryl transferase